MTGYALRRVLSTVPVFIFVALFVFFLLRITPGDPAIMIAGDQASSAQIETIREQLGLNRPLLDQLLAWAGQLLRGDLGRSVFSDIPVTRLIGQRLEPTAMLALVAIVLAIAIALPLGTLAAVRAGGLADRVVMAFAVLGFSSPVFVIAFLLVTCSHFRSAGFLPRAMCRCRKASLPACIAWSCRVSRWRCCMPRCWRASRARACSKCCRKITFARRTPRG